MKYQIREHITIFITAIIVILMVWLLNQIGPLNL